MTTLRRGTILKLQDFVLRSCQVLGDIFLYRVNLLGLSSSQNIWSQNPEFLYANCGEVNFNLKFSRGELQSAPRVSTQVHLRSCLSSPLLASLDQWTQIWTRYTWSWVGEVLPLFRRTSSSVWQRNYSPVPHTVQGIGMYISSPAALLSWRTGGNPPFEIWTLQGINRYIHGHQPVLHSTSE